MSSYRLLLLLFIVQCLAITTVSASGVKLIKQNNHVVMDNGILQVTISTPKGLVTGIQYKDIKNLLSDQNDEDNRGYWDHNFSTGTENSTDERSKYDRIGGTIYKVVKETEQQVELSFTRTWNKEGNIPPMNIDIRFVMLQGSSGFYSYAIYNRLKGWPACGLANNRMVLKPNDRFTYMAISDDRQRDMPSAKDRAQGQQLAYPEAVLLRSGEVDDKYQYSIEAKDLQVHGWITSDSMVGLWQILPSGESRCFGPVKQFLTSHTGPTSINTFHSTHYVGEKFGMNFVDGEAWMKVFGPFFVYVNSSPGKGDRQILWGDAKKQFNAEVKSWPYAFPESKDFAKSDQRGSISGRLLVNDGRAGIGAKGAYVGLAKPGEPGSWQTESKGYQFWAVANEAGDFSINNVLVGDYNLYAFVPGFIGDFKHPTPIKITPGSATKIGNLVYQPPRNGPTLWEIGIPDRSAAEFLIPDPNSKYINKLYLKKDRFRQYGLWERFGELHVKEDLAYKVATNKYNDWYFAQNTRKSGNGYEGTTWQINFTLDKAVKSSSYTLRVAVAAAHAAELEIRVNSGPAEGGRPLFTSGLFGSENAIARHGIHGLYRLFSVDVPGNLLRDGLNTLYLKQTRNSIFTGIMYDYIRLEGPRN